MAQPITGIRVYSCRCRERHAALRYAAKQSSKGENFSLLFLLQGKMEIVLRERAYIADKGCCILIEPTESAAMKALPGEAPSYYSLSFLPQSESGKPLSLKESGLESIYRAHNPGKMATLLEQITRLFNGRNPDRLIKCSILGLRLMLELKPAPGANRIFPNLPDNRDSDERLEDAVEYIHRNYKKRIPLRTLADKASLHPNQFIRAFKKATGLTPHKYLLSLKVEKAKDFLLFYRETPAVAALELGFHDYAHFSRVFRQKTGLSPRQFRNQFR